MTSFRVDGGLAFHAKAARAGNSALGLWVRAGAWCGQHHTDGVIPHQIAKTMGKPSEIKALVSVGFWDEVEGGSYRFHDWSDYNFSPEVIARRRQGERLKKQAWRKSKKIFERDGWACVSCASPEDLTVDHINPRSNGGGGEDSNLQTLCRSCNSTKGASVEVVS